MSCEWTGPTDNEMLVVNILRSRSLDPITRQHAV